MVESIDDRPIYFASSGNAAISLGVQPYLVRQGLAFKLHNGPVAESEELFTRLAPSAYSSVTGDWLHESRTRTLMDEVFLHRGGIPQDWDHWPDIATVGIPNYYSWVYTALMQASSQAGDAEAVERYQLEAESWLTLGTPTG